MINLQVQRIIDYFDYPQLFLAKDIVSTNYLCMLIGVNKSNLEYLSTKISPKRLYELETNKCDLRVIYENPEIPEYYKFTLSDNTEEFFQINIFQESIASYLPDHGLFVGAIDKYEELKRLAIAKNKYIFMLHLIEEGKTQSVSAALVSSFLIITQKMIKNSFIQGVKDISKDIKRRITELKSAEMGVFALSAGSLNVIFSTNSFVDMFGNSDDNIYLNKLKQIVELDISDFDNIKLIFRMNKGHLLSSLEQLCKKIISTGSIFELLYSSPNSEDEGRIVIDKHKAKVFYDYINSETELKDEIIEYSAYFVQADVEKDNWRIRIPDEKKEISGKSPSGLLSGVTLEEQKYKVICREILFEDPIYSEEKKQYELISYSPIIE